MPKKELYTVKQLLSILCAGMCNIILKRHNFKTFQFVHSNHRQNAISFAYRPSFRLDDVKEKTHFFRYRLMVPAIQIHLKLPEGNSYKQSNSKVKKDNERREHGVNQYIVSMLLGQYFLSENIQVKSIETKQKWRKIRNYLYCSI